MSLLNKFTKSFRWLRWSTVCAILFYAFFIGLILHSTTYKIQDSFKSRNQPHPHPDQQQPQQQQQPTQDHELHETFFNDIKQQLNSINSNNMPQKPHKLTFSNGILQHPEQQQQHHNSNGNRIVGDGGGDVGDGDGSVGGHGSHPLKVTLDKTIKNVRVKSGEPETVILAASSMNEKKILEKAFKRADGNRDKRLTIQEMAFYINKRIVDHIEEAIAMNPREFRRVDISPPDGLITWDEYHRFFLKEHGMTDKDIDEHNEIKHTGINRKAREDMMRDKARWSEAARTDLFSLTIDEYLSFRHPESSVSNLLELVDDLLRQFDLDGDDQLTVEEFSELNVDDDDDLLRKSLISKTKIERREEFKRIIDKNHDGRADRGELLDYVNPKTPRYALQEAATLFSLCDENHDGKLTLQEMVENAEIILTSKMIDTANSFHTEF